MAAPAQPDPTIAPPAEEDAGGRMSFFEHLLDLRKRLIYSAAAIAVGAGHRPAGLQTFHRDSGAADAAGAALRAF